jgi:hypothetical protein
MVDRRTLQSCAYALVGVGGALPIVFVPKLIFGLGPHPGNDPAFVWVSTACMTAGVAWGCYFAFKSFRRSDEFVQARAKFAWYWGSMIGIAAMAPIFGFAMFGGLQWFMPSVAAMGRDGWLTYAFGLLTPLIAQMMGFGAVSLWWRVTKQ